MTDTLSSAFREQIKKAIEISNVPTTVTEENVFQEGNPGVLAIMDGMVGSLLLPGSGIEGMENLETLYDKAKAGKSCLLLAEHYSNFDLSIVSLLVRNAGGRGKEIRDSIIAIAGMKLNEDNPAVAALASAYTRIVIYPSRSLKDLDPEKDKAEFVRSNSINRAALKSLIRHKYKGSIILVFPSGTRFRPWDPSTKKGVKDVDTYVRSFDYMCLAAINGEVLHVQKTDMMNDAVSKDLVRVTIGPVISCDDFRNRVLADFADKEKDIKKQMVADAIMAELEKIHDSAEIQRKKLLG